jgi:hypothetical protein
VKQSKRVYLILVCAVLLAGVAVPVNAQQTTGSYFSQTGHNVLGEFWTFYQNVADAAVVFGLPITEQFGTADGSGLTVQYFEKVRLELYPDEPIGQRVKVSALGTKLYTAGAPSVNVTTPGACRVINGFGICYDFLAYFDLHGGTARFGNPISAFEFQPDGRILQYFEQARFEWHPELAVGQNVTLGDYGKIYFGKAEDLSWLNPVLPFGNNAPIQTAPVTALRVMAFTARAVTQPTDRQKIFIIVQDEALRPVAGATGNVTIYLPDGQNMVYPVTTDVYGIGVVPAVRFADQLPGSLVTVDVQMSYLGLDVDTMTSFRIWR